MSSIHEALSTLPDSYVSSNRFIYACYYALVTYACSSGDQEMALSALKGYERLVRGETAIMAQPIFDSIPLSYAQSKYMIGVLYRIQENYSRSEPYLKEACYLRKIILGPNSPQLAEAYEALAYVKYKSHEVARALVLWKAALVIYCNYQDSYGKEIDRLSKYVDRISN